MGPIEPNFKLNVNTSESLGRETPPVEKGEASSGNEVSAKPEGERSDAKLDNFKAQAEFESKCESVAVGRPPLLGGTPCPSCGYCPSCGRGPSYQPFWYQTPWYSTGPNWSTSPVTITSGTTLGTTAQIDHV